MWRLDSETAKRPEANQIIQGRISDAQWIGANEFAYTSTQSRHPGLVLMDSTGVEMNRLFEHGNFRWFGVDAGSKTDSVLGFRQQHSHRRGFGSST